MKEASCRIRTAALGIHCRTQALCDAVKIRLFCPRCYCCQPTCGCAPSCSAEPSYDTSMQKGVEVQKDLDTELQKGLELQK